MDSLIQSLAEIAEHKTNGSVLLVDNDTNIGSTLKRLLRPLGHDFNWAENAQQGFAVLEEKEVDLVIADVRLCGADGVEFLEEVRQRWPDVIRIVLTGFPDLTATIAAINKSKIYQYISKPWEDTELKFSVQHAIEQRKLTLERGDLLEIAGGQNQKLKSLNHKLSIKIKELEQL